MRRTFLQLSGSGVVSKVLGAARELLLANFFGTGVTADSYRASQTLTLSPTHLFTRLLQASFVPLYAKEHGEDDERAGRLFLAVLVVFLAIAFAVAAALFAFGGPVVRAVLPGLSAERASLSLPKESCSSASRAQARASSGSSAIARSRASRAPTRSKTDCRA